MDYVTFLLDLAGAGENRAIRETVRYRRDPKLRPRSAFEWQVTCDAQGKVIVVGHVRNRPEVIATARWHAGTLAEHKHLEPRSPTGYQWGLVQSAIRAELKLRSAMHDRSGEPPVAPRDLVEDPTTPGGTVAKDLVEDVKRIEARMSPAPAAVLDQLDAVDEDDRMRKARNRDERRRKNRREIFMALGAFTVTFVVGIAMCSRSSRDDADVKEAPTSPEPVRAVQQLPDPPAPVPSPPPVVEDPVEVRITRAVTFAEAVALAKPAMTDTTDELAGGGKLLATYAAAKLRWEDVDVAAETTVGHVLKDSDVERGKRMCVDGVITTIERRDLERRKVYVGALRLADDDTVTFLAVGTTGELVKRRAARFCGAVIGTAGRSVSMVGMFDLPENRTPIVEQ